MKPFEEAPTAVEIGNVPEAVIGPGSVIKGGGASPPGQPSRALSTPPCDMGGTPAHYKRRISLCEVDLHGEGC